MFAEETFLVLTQISNFFKFQHKISFLQNIILGKFFQQKSPHFLNYLF